MHVVTEHQSVTASAALQSARIRPLAITSITRSKHYPDLATLDEQGVTGYEYNFWIGVFAPAATPKDIAAKLGVGIKDALAMPDVRARFETAGMEVRSGAAAELRQVLAADIVKWSKLVRDNNIQLVQ
jgi:tripartite-type tricarboxylate transporter receptor subunit TctC